MSASGKPEAMSVDVVFEDLVVLISEQQKPWDTVPVALRPECGEKEGPIVHLRGNSFARIKAALLENFGLVWKPKEEGGGGVPSRNKSA